MLRVLTLSTLFPDSSRPRLGPFVERQTLGLAAHPDVEVQIVAPIGLPPWPLTKHAHYRALAALPIRENWHGTIVHRPRFLHLPGLQGRFDAGAMARALIPAVDAIRDTFPFDVIDAEYFFPDGPAAVTLGKRYRVPVSIKARGSDIHLWGRAPATAAQVLAAGRDADGMLAVCAPLKADMVALGMPEARIIVHYTGVDLDRFRVEERSVAKAKLGIAGPLVVSIGGLVRRKRHDIVIDAIANLPGATLAIIGHGPERDALAEAAKKAGISEFVRFTGSIGHDEIADWLAAADVMALATESEGLANVWVEALACGTPVVTTDVGGAREVFTDPVVGRLSAPDPHAFATAIADLIETPPDRNACRAAATRFSWDTNRASLYAHLCGLVSGRSLPAG